MFRTFLLKYGEIFLKGKNRYMFEDALVEQVRRAVSKCDGEFEVHKSLSRIYVEALGDFDYDELIEALSTVFGVTAICPVLVLEDNGFDALKADVVKYVDETYEEKNFTFKVHSRRARIR